MSELVRLEVDEATGVGTIRLDRPKMNAINEEVTEGLAEAAREATFNDKIKAVVLWGGEKIFAAGADIKMMADRTPAEMMNRIGMMQSVFSMIEEIPKVTIAAINGYALGGGCELAMTCDFRVVADNAQMAIKRGLEMDLGDGLAFEREVFVNLFATDDQKIGMKSFMEQGPGKAEFVGH